MENVYVVLTMPEGNSLSAIPNGSHDRRPHWLRLGLSGMALVFLTVTGRGSPGRRGNGCLRPVRRVSVSLRLFRHAGHRFLCADDCAIPADAHGRRPAYSGTLNVGHAIPTIAQALIDTSLIEVDRVTLVSMIAASALGAWLGAGIVAGWPKRRVQVGIGFALSAAAFLMSRLNFSSSPAAARSLACAACDWRSQYR